MAAAQPRSLHNQHYIICFQQCSVGTTLLRLIYWTASLLACLPKIDTKVLVISNGHDHSFICVITFIGLYIRISCNSPPSWTALHSPHYIQQCILKQYGCSTQLCYPRETDILHNLCVLVSLTGHFIT